MAVKAKSEKMYLGHLSFAIEERTTLLAVYNDLLI